MSKEGKPELNRSELAKKLVDVRNIDPELAQDYKAKVEQTAEYQESHKEKIEARKSQTELNKENSTNETEKAEKIKKIKEEMANMQTVQSTPENPAQSEFIKNIEQKMPFAEAVFRSKFDELIKEAETEKDKEYFKSIISGLDKLKFEIKKYQKEFEKETHYSPTSDNMSKHWNNLGGDRNELKKALIGKGEPYSPNNISLYGASQANLKKIFKKFDIPGGGNYADTLEFYNKHLKSFLEKSAKMDKKHDIVLHIPIEGLSFQSTNYGGDDKVGKNFPSINFSKETLKKMFDENIEK